MVKWSIDGELNLFKKQSSLIKTPLIPNAFEPPHKEPFNFYLGAFGLGLLIFDKGAYLT